MDVWSLGCLLVNLAVPRGGLFDARRTGPDLLKQIERMFGKKEDEDVMEWRKKAAASLWSRFESNAPDGRDLAPDGAMAVWRRLTDQGVALLLAMLRPDPAGRRTSAGVLLRPYCNSLEMRCIRHAPAERGTFSLVTGHLEKRILEWIRDDHRWEGCLDVELTRRDSDEPPQQKKQKCMADCEVPYQKETWYVC